MKAQDLCRPPERVDKHLDRPQDIKAGENTELAVKKALKDSVFFLALLSTSSVNQRGAFQKELKQAIDMLAEHSQEDIFIVPVRLDDCNPTDAILDGLHIVDLHTTSWKNGFEKIMRALGKAIDNQNWHRIGNRTQMKGSKYG